MSPPDAAEAPGKGPHQNHSDQAERFGPNGTARPARTSPTLVYLERRELILGRRLVLHREPAIAATLLVEELGPLAARAWCRSLLEELGQ